VTAGELVASLRRRGVELLIHSGRLGVRPQGSLTPGERAALIAAKAEVLALLRGRDSEPPTAADGWADGVPDGPCVLCGSPLAWVEDWPSAGEARWFCPTCAAWPAPSLAEVYQTFTAAERWRLDVEAAQGDALARAVLRELGGPAARRATG